MATIAATSLKADAVSVTPTTTTLDGTDDLVYNGKTQRQLLVIHNATGGPLNITMVGDESAVFMIDGYGNIDPTSGYQFTVADTESASLLLSGVDRYLKGTVSITGGTGATAELYDIA